MVPLISVFIEHVGIRDLNVVGCVREIMEGNLHLCSEASEGLMRKLISANIKHGQPDTLSLLSCYKQYTRRSVLYSCVWCVFLCVGVTYVSGRRARWLNILEIFLGNTITHVFPDFFIFNSQRNLAIFLNFVRQLPQSVTEARLKRTRP